MTIQLAQNIRTFRKQRALTQEQLAEVLGVTVGAVYKWEAGLSVPDSAMLIALSQTLETPVSTLLGETVTKPEADDLKAICEKLEVINLQLAQRKIRRRKLLHWLFILLCGATTAVFVFLAISASPYLDWNYNDPETAVFGAAFHAFEWVFVRAAPVILIGSVIGMLLTRKER